MYSINVSAQIHNCGADPKIKGPLVLNCSGVTHAHYYIDANLVNQTTWSINPTTAGALSVLSISDVNVDWDSSAANPTVKAYLLLSYNNNSGTDTLWPQICCSGPAGAQLVQDIDDYTQSPGGPQVIKDAFYIAGVPGSSVWTPSTNIVTVTGGTYFIAGQLNLDQTILKFNDCTLFMGPGAVIYTRLGHYSGVNAIEGEFVCINTHLHGTQCGMWRGIVSNNDSKMYFEKSSIEDAEFAIYWGSCLLALTCKATTFNNNYVSVFSQRNLTGTKNYFINLGSDPTEFHNCTFDCSYPMTLPPFNGQYGVPINQRPLAGMYFNDLTVGGGLPTSIPFSTLTTSACKFKNMNYGVFGVNSDIDVHNCSFERIYNGMLTVYNTSAVYSDYTCSWCDPSNPVNLNVGSSALHSNNVFNNCQAGIESIGEVNSNISTNSFYHNNHPPVSNYYDVYLHKSNDRSINVSDNNFYDFNMGIYLRSTSRAKIAVNTNTFTQLNALDPHDFNSTAITIIGNSGTLITGNVYNNTFNDSRIGIYLNGIQGFSPDNHALLINANHYNNDINFTDIENLYNHGFGCFGIWGDNIRYITFEGNYFQRSTGIAGAPHGFDKMLRGFNFKQGTFLDLTANSISDMGTPMRYLGNCDQTRLFCNNMNECVNGIFLDYAYLLDQGASSDPAWDNTWTNYTTDRVLGNLLNTGNYINWYCQDLSNQFSVLPSATNLVTAVIAPAGNCPSVGNGHRSADRLMQIAGNNIQYSIFPSQSRYLDKLIAFEALKEDSTLRDSLPILASFYQTEMTGNIGIFNEAKDLAANGDYSAALNQLSSITVQNNIEANKKYIRILESQNAMAGNETYSVSEVNSLTNIALQPAWLGGDAVFEARGKLMMEVDDQTNNLRISKDKSDISGNSFSVFPNPASDYIELHSYFSMNGNLIITDAIGRVVLKKQLQNGFSIVTGLDNGFYTAQFLEGNQVIGVQKFYVIK